VGFLALVLYVPFLRDLFRFDALHAIDLVICLAAGAASVIWFEAFKAINVLRRRAPARRT
jgi:Ca2+-transporting ATPase